MRKGSELYNSQYLSGNLDIYVSVSSGNDGNIGLTPLKPFKTLQRAWNHICTAYVLMGACINVNIEDGYYPNGCSSTPSPALGIYDGFYDNPLSPIGSGTIKFRGNVANRGAVQIDGVDELSDWSSFELNVPNTVLIHLDDLQINGSANISGSSMYVGNIRLKGAYTQLQAGFNGYVFCRFGKTIEIDGGNGDVNGNAYLAAGYNGLMVMHANVSITSPVNCPNGLFRCYNFGKIQLYGGLSITGTNSGKKYIVNAAGLLNTNGRTIPGSAGSVDAGGTVL